MGKPTYQQVHVDVPLTNISVAYTPGEYIGMNVFPQVPVVHISDKYFIYTKADWMRNEVGVRAPGTKAARGDWGLQTSTYFVTEKAIAKGVPDEIVQNADNPIKPLEDSTRWVTEQLYQKVEIDTAAICFGNSIWSSSATPSVLWSAALSNPMTDVRTAIDTVVQNIGRLPNQGCLGYQVFSALLNNAEVVERIKYGAGPGAPAAVTLAALGALFGGLNLMVGVAVQDSAQEGATSSLGFIWGKHMLVHYVSPGPSLISPTSGYVFTYQQRQISRFREDQNRQDVVEGRWSYSVNQIATDAGYLLKSVTA